jgi:putative addiction module component (TIGR02574 family)
MSRNAAEIFDEARQLPFADREWLAASLLSEDEELDEAFCAEIDRRVAEDEAGRGASCSWEELEARLRARLAS